MGYAWHLPRAQVSPSATPGHAFPQPPQLLESVPCKSTQLPAQFVRPALQESPQRPAVQVPVPPAIAHEVVQVPQWAASAIKLTSQPSAAVPLQSAKPATQDAMAHVPVAQVEFACAKAHAFPHVPQLLVLVRLASQPLAALPSQSANPPLHDAMAHCDPVHVGAALESAQTLPHAPQLFLLLVRSTSHPLGVR